MTQKRVLGSLSYFSFSSFPIFMGRPKPALFSYSFLVLAGGPKVQNLFCTPRRRKSWYSKVPGIQGTKIQASTTPSFTEGLQIAILWTCWGHLGPSGPKSAKGRQPVPGQSGPLNRLNAILSLLQPLDRYRTPSAIGSAIGKALSRPISHPHTGRSPQPPRSKPLRGLNRAIVAL